MKCHQLWLLVVTSILGFSQARRTSYKTGAFKNGHHNVSQEQDVREARFFSLFNVVQFENSACQSNTGATGSGNERNGTCYTSTQCNDRGGIAGGNCAAGFGVCCVFVYKDASSEVSQNCSYIINPSFPASDNSANSISYTVSKCSDDVCMLRLDFETFVLQGVGGTNLVNEGVCTDTFTVTTSTSQVVPTICGLNTGYHIYVDIGANSGDTARLAFTFDGTVTNRRWDIKVTQLECDNVENPPEGCLQYHTGLTGRMETFNFQAENDNHLNNQKYSICVRAQPGMCCIRYFPCPGETSAFSLETLSGQGNDDRCAEQLNGAKGRDHIIIAQSDNTCQVGASRSVHSRYCGGIFNAQLLRRVEDDFICDCTSPFYVGIYTNDISDPLLGGVNTKHSRVIYSRTRTTTFKQLDLDARSEENVKRF